MDLRYHQATHTMLTGQRIDTAGYLDYLAEHEAVYGQPLSDSHAGWTKIPLFQHPPTMSDSAVQHLNQFEHEYRIKLPGSVREWYSLDIGLPMLYVRGNWMPSEIDKWGQPRHRFEGMGATYRSRNIQLLDNNLLIFIGEQQAGDWCIHLNGSDDPPVCKYQYVTGIDYPAYHVHFDEESPRFSDFIYCWLWDWLADYQCPLHFSIMWHSALRSLQLEPEYYVPIEQVRRSYNEIPQRWFPEHRFYGEGVRFSMCPYVDDATRVGHGMFYADNADALRELIQRIWGDNPPLRRMRHVDDVSQKVINGLKQL